MDNTQEQYIQKKLLYKFEKKLELVNQEYMKHMFPSSGLPPKLTKQELLKEISNLQFINFKYKTALLSENTDFNHNNLQLVNLDHKIRSTKDEIKVLQEQLQKAQIAKKNKQKFNLFAEQLKRYDKKTQSNQKFQGIQNEIKQLEENYQKEMGVFRTRERLLKASISALQCLFKDIQTSNKGESEVALFANKNVQMEEEDDGQIE